MAQSDWVITADSFTGGPDGTVQLHSTLSNPLTGEGAFARQFTTAFKEGSFVPVSGLVTSSAGFSESKSYSLRMWVRTTSNTQGYAALNFKANNLDMSSFQGHAGYKFGVGIDSNSSTSGFFFMKNSTVVTSSIAGITAPVDTWFKLRMDIIPVTTAYDIINLYTGSGTTGAETWGQITSIEIHNTSSNYLPWNETGRGLLGFSVYTGNGQTVFVDRFQLFTENI